jgi:hypothetical protein
VLCGELRVRKAFGERIEDKKMNYVGCDVQQIYGCIPEVEVAKRVGRRLDWVTAEVESPVLVRTEAEVEK